MAGIEIRIPSGSRIPGVDSPVNVMEIGNPGQPTDLIIHNGRLYIYNTLGQTLIDGGVIQTQGVAVGLKSWVHNIVFSATDQDTAAWAAGAVYFGDGSHTNINSGNTGNITSKTYLYYDGTDTLKKTTNVDFLGNTYILLATIEKADTVSEKAIITVSQLPSGTINADQIVAGYLNFNRAKGGTLQLGGDGNGYGIFSLKDSSDVEKIRMDKDGILVNSGKITIKDEDESSVIDSKGIVSATQFFFDSAFAGIANPDQTDSLIYVDMDDMVLNFNLARETKLLILFNASIGQGTPNFNSWADITLDIDGVDIDDDIRVGGAFAADGYFRVTVMIHSVQTLAAGDHTIKVRWRVSHDDVYYYVSARRLSYLLLGK